MNTKHTSEVPGVRQHHAECHLPCNGPPGPNRFPFAPGVIDGPAAGSSEGWVAEVIAVTIALGAVCAVFGFATGYIRIPGWLL